MQRLTGYSITGKLHEGNGTVLYTATQSASAESVVVKLTASGHTAHGLAKLVHEHAVLDGLRIPGVVKARGLETTDGGVALVLEYIEDPPLSRILAEARLDLRASLEIACRCARVLADLHAAGIVHKDIKPHNILCNLASLDIHVIDFGISMRSSAEMHTSVSAEAYEGTLAYMSPEQTGRMNRGLDRRTDLYSLGVTLYECLVGRRPFTSDDPLTLIHSHVARTPAAPHELDASIPEVVSRIVMKLLAKAAEDRYQSAAGLAVDLERCLAALDERGTIDEFELAREDQTGELSIPQRLYGRRAELAVLDQAFARVRDGAAELVLVAGYSGIGKSALVNEIHKPIAGQRGLFAAGKFDQLNRATPHASIGAAFGTLVRLILSERAQRLEHWRTRLLDAFGSTGQVLIDLIPELELIVGPQPPVPTLGPTEAQNRFNLLFRRFIDVLADAEHPFVLFLDDLQWADPASLRLLESLLADGGRRHFLLIGAYRDNEVDRAHPLSLTLDALREAGVEPRMLQLAPLSLADVGELLGEVVGSEPRANEDLARVVHAKTHGNPFFVNQFIRALHHDALLRFDGEQRRWCYDLAEVEARAYTDNVIDLMTAKIERLPAECREVLSLAACIGFGFDLQTLATIARRPADETHRALWLAVERGLIVALDGRHTLATNQDYRFLHDRVQQAAYDLVAPDRRAATHLTIGRLLAAACDGHELDSRLFEIANHLNRGASLIDDVVERRELMRLDLRAGQRAKAATAYAGASDYLRCAIELVVDDDWTQDERLCFDLHREYAACEYLCSRYEHAEELFRALIERARDELDRADVYIIRLRLYQVAGRYKDGVQLACEALAELGVRFPDEPEAINAAIAAEAAAVLDKLGERSVASLIDAPRMTDPRRKRIMGLLAGLLPCAYIGQPQVFPLGALRMVNESLEHGNTEESCFAYSVYGLMSVSVFGDIPRGLEFSTMSIALNERFGDTALRGTLLHLHGDHINFWSHHIRSDFPILEQAFQACLEAGDLVYASYLAFETVWQAIERGDTPDEVRALAERYRVFASQTKNAAVHETIRMQERYLAFLDGRTDDWSESPRSPADAGPSRAGWSEDASLRLVSEASFGCGVVFFHVIELMTAYAQGRYVDALAAAAAARPVLGAAMAMPIEATFHLYEALTLLTLPDASAERVADHLAKLELWATHCPDNFEHKHLLVRAELARVEGRAEAAALYDRAIESAREHGFVQYEALGNELAGRYYHGLGRERIAPVYLNAAYVAYLRWGALRLAAALVEQFPAHVSVRVGTDPSTRRSELAAATLVHATSTGTHGAHTAIDLGTVLRATQVIAGELDITRLVGELMRLVLDNAGGADASLFFADGDELRLAARGTTEPDTLELGGELPLDACDHVAAAIVRLTARTLEVQVIGDACNDPVHARDPHIARAQVRSILCIPLLHRQQLTGVLYIEHPRVKGVFVAERVALLEMLSLQVAGAMDNARLYANIQATSAELRRANERLEAEVLARTEQLLDANERLRLQLDERTRSEQARNELHEHIIALQRERLEELATPMIPITDDVRVLPLVGTVDDTRAGQVLEAALDDAHRHRTRTLLIDLTGIRNADAESVARTLARTARALALVGTEVVLTGIGPALARAFVLLGLDVSGLGTHATLQDGIAYAMRKSSVRARA